MRVCRAEGPTCESFFPPFCSGDKRVQFVQKSAVEFYCLHAHRHPINMHVGVHTPTVGSCVWVIEAFSIIKAHFRALHFRPLQCALPVMSEEHYNISFSPPLLFPLSLRDTLPES